MKFTPKNTNFDLSPYTGMTRESWIEAGEYLLEGMFKNIKHFEDPVVMPRKETKITYPQPNSTKERIKAAQFEGLTRSFFIAAPLIHIEPELMLGGYSVKDYYKSQVLRACTPGDDNYIGNYEDLLKWTGRTDRYAIFQQTVETCALVIGLWLCRDEIWNTYTKAQKDIIADFLSTYAKAETAPQNWRLFNMLDMAFLNMEGYEIDTGIMMEHAQAILNFYAGDGWYRDGHSFDYYSVWAFNVYSAFWNLWYGYEKAPYIAQKFEEYQNKLMETYADFFDRDGFVNMWGRSCIYRFAATSAFDANFMFKNPAADPGRSRRIMSGALLQFMTREDFLYEGVPTLGFYGQFTPLVQGYSCAESPYWMGKAFLCLHLPADHPFWTAKENNGTWDELARNEVKVTVLDGPALCFSNHQANGETILRTGKVLKNKGDEHGMWNYSKLCFNTKYPWEAAPCAEVEAQQYVLCDLNDMHYEKCNVTFWHGLKKEVLYRRQFFNFNLSEECTHIQAVNLADFEVPYGIMRVDKLRLRRRPVRVTLGAYGFPDNGTQIIKKESKGAKAVILKGTDFKGNEKQLAMTVYESWDDIGYVKSTGTNPDSQNSIVVYGEVTAKKQYGYEKYILISQVITKESHEDFTDAELFPIEDIIYTDTEKCGGYGPVTLKLKDGSTKMVEFEGIEGNLQL